MPPRADSPLRKITLNLYDEDVVRLERRYGYGWSQKVRELIHDHVRPAPENQPEFYLQEDFEDE